MSKQTEKRHVNICFSISSNPRTGAQFRSMLLSIIGGICIFFFVFPACAEPVIITINPDASAQLQTTAAELAGFLKQAGIAAEVPVQRGQPAASGSIYLSTAADSPAQTVPAELKELGGEAVFIEATAENAVIIGNSELAVQHGIMIYLDALGFRWFFPHEAWHIIPRLTSAFTPFRTVTAPAYENRRIWYAYGTASSKADTDYRNWFKTNRQGGAFQISCGHSYDGIIHSNKAAFAANPEFFALSADGKRKTNKFCVTNQGLIDLCIADRLRGIDVAVAAGREINMVSMDPSDGAGTCECPECLKLGSTSDRIFSLANHVARAVAEKYPGKWVGLYAYSSHQLPTEIKLEPNIYVQLATAFNRTPYSIDELITLWGQRVRKLGIREYYGVMAWDWDMPAAPRGAKLAYIRRSIPHFHAQNANAINAESNIGWISRGLGHYIAARLMWDVNADVDALVNDFYEKSFGAARAQIETMFNEWQRYHSAMPAEHDLARWLKLVAETDAIDESAAVKARINQVKAYLHYVALYMDWQNGRADRDFKTLRQAKDAKKTELDLDNADLDALMDNTAGALDNLNAPEAPQDPDDKYRTYLNLLSYAWRVKDLGIVASYPLARRIANTAAPLPEYKFNHPECVWHDTRPVTAAEIQQNFHEDMQRYQEITGLSGIQYSNVYEPLAVEPEPLSPSKLRFPHEFIVLIPEKGEPYLKVAIGFIYKEVWRHQVRFYRLDQEIDDENDEPLLAQEIVGDQEFHNINIAALSPGVYRMLINDRRSGIRIDNGGGLKVSLKATANNKIRTSGRNNLCFFVPEGTEKFIIQTGGPLNLQAPDGNIFNYQENTGRIEIEVSAGSHGIWRMLHQSGTFYLMGIPPVAAFTPQDLLIPQPVRE